MLTIIPSPDLIGGSGTIVPPQGWVDLINPVPSASTHAEGLHTYTHDIAVGPKDNGTATTIGDDAQGLYIATGSLNYSRAIYRPLACSAGLDPVISMVVKFANHLFIGADDETSPDVNAYDYSASAWGASVNSPAVYSTARSTSATSIGWAASSNSWYRIEVSGGSTCLVNVHLLPSGDPVDWDTDNLVASGQRAVTAGGSSIIYPVFATGIATNDRIRAVRVVPRRS
jgi:hypothetical protein